MKKTNIFIVSMIFLLFLTGPILATENFSVEYLIGQTKKPIYSYQIIESYPHPQDNFTQGLEVKDGLIYEGTGLKGHSKLVNYSPANAYLNKINLPLDYFGEGITIFQKQIYQLTWKSEIGFIYQADTFKFINNFYYEGEGWGLTHNENYLIKSDGSSTISFHQPGSFAEVKTMTVTDNGYKLEYLNELEYINGIIYANIWLTDYLALIDASTGEVIAYVDLKELSRPFANTADVLNGIAYYPEKDAILVTGKLWPKMYLIKILN